jgi:hypothetical protein
VKVINQKKEGVFKNRHLHSRTEDAEVENGSAVRLRPCGLDGLILNALGTLAGHAPLHSSAAEHRHANRVPCSPLRHWWVRGEAEVKRTAARWLWLRSAEATLHATEWRWATAVERTAY